MASQKMVELVLTRRWENEIEPIFIEELQKCASVVYHMEVLKHFIEECAGSIQWEVWENFG